MSIGIAVLRHAVSDVPCSMGTFWILVCHSSGYEWNNPIRICIMRLSPR